MLGSIPAYGGLFCVAFLAATLLPAQSEALLLALTATKKYSIKALVAFASLGNILGSIVNWWLGTKLEQFKDKKWFPVKKETLERSEDRYKRYGRWLLLLSWVPIIGDTITIAAGVMKERIVIFLIIVSIAKIARYLFIVEGYNAIFWQ